MHLKKSKEANLEPRRKGWFNLGLLGACALTLAAFEFTVWEEDSTSLSELRMNVLEEEVIDEYKIPLPPKPTPPEPKIDLSLPPEIVPETNPNEVDLEKEKEKEKHVETPEGPFTDIPGDPEEEPVDNDIEFTIVEQMPHWKTDKKMTKDELRDYTDRQILKHFQKNFKVPQIAKDADAGGKLYVSFVVDQNGDITNVDVHNSKHPSLDKEAIRCVNLIPQMEPGKQRMRPVKVRMTVPINVVIR